MPPFKSEAQRKYLYANEPEIAKKWSAEEKAMDKDDMHGDVEAAYEEHEGPDDDTVTCPACGKKFSASNAGGASVGGGAGGGG
jgi:hypothetical protein